MTPSECVDAIEVEYKKLCKKAADKKINESCIYGIISSRCRDAARHNGQPELWESYMPDDLWNKHHGA